MTPPLEIVTIVLNGMPFLPIQYETFKKYPGKLGWNIAHGAAENSGSTAWCKSQSAGLSGDGTTELLRKWSHHEPWITIREQPLWDGGKDHMFRASVEVIKKPCIILQVDVDEFWTVEQLVNIAKMFSDFPGRTHAMFWCRYYFGPRIIMTTRNCYANNPGQDWKRAWCATDNMYFKSHEPPGFTNERRAITHAETEARGLVFDHAGYMYRHQVEYKERFYGYKNAVEQWERLQANTIWPVRLNKFLAWVPPNDTATVDLIR